mgnify:CR=1 FL=1
MSTQKIDRARETASDVLVQWDGVDIDWSNLAGELAAHWADATEEPYTDPEFRALVVAEIERGARAAIRDLVRQDAEELDELTEPAAAQIARWRACARQTGDRDLLRALDILGDKAATDIYAGTAANRAAKARAAAERAAKG